jgi:hypothetical protein
MATRSVTIARVYLREGEHLLGKLVKYLHDDEKVSGVTVLRGIAGFGPDGLMRPASLVDLSFDLPLIVEFFGDHEQVDSVVGRLQTQFGLSHIVSWSAAAHLSGAPSSPPDSA